MKALVIAQMLIGEPLNETLQDRATSRSLVIALVV